MEMFEVRNQRQAWKPRHPWAPAEELELGRRLFSWAPLGGVRVAAELGTEDGARTRAMAELLPAGAVITAFGLVPDASLDLGAGGRIDYRGFPSDAVLALPAQSQDLFFSFYCLERFRMDHLYMALSEARRVTKVDGYAALVVWAPGVTGWERWRDWVAYRLRGEKPLRLDHYISPEDWDVVRAEFASVKGRRSQLLLLRRV